MTSIEAAFSNEAVQSMAAQLLGGGRKYDKVIYWRRPQVNPDGSPNDAPGWIITASSDAFRLLENIARGWQPLTKYPPVRYGSNQDESSWASILNHPDGPGEFPVEQILTFRWYDPDRLFRDTGLRGIKWPQLKGVAVTEYDCPECNNRVYAKPVHLARHLTIDHNYDRANLIALGDQLGISFEKEKVKDGRVQRTYTYDEDFAAEVQRAPVATEPAAVAVTKVKPAGKRTMSEDQKQVLRDRLARARDAKAAKQSA